jgi:hypothetical protein
VGAKSSGIAHGGCTCMCGGRVSVSAPRGALGLSGLHRRSLGGVDGGRPRCEDWPCVVAAYRGTDDGRRRGSACARWRSTRRSRETEATTGWLRCGWVCGDLCCGSETTWRGEWMSGVTPVVRIGRWRVADPRRDGHTRPGAGGFRPASRLGLASANQPREECPSALAGKSRARYRVRKVTARIEDWSAPRRPEKPMSKGGLADVFSEALWRLPGVRYSGSIARRRGCCRDRAAAWRIRAPRPRGPESCSPIRAKEGASWMRSDPQLSRARCRDFRARAPSMRQRRSRRSASVGASNTCVVMD